MHIVIVMLYVVGNLTISTYLLARMQRTNDPDAIELFLKKVSMVDKASGNVTVNWINPIEGLQKTKEGGMF